MSKVPEQKSEVEIYSDEIEQIKERINILFENSGDAYFELKARIEKLELHYYSDGDLSAIHGQIDNINKNNEHRDFEIGRLNTRVLELEEWTRKDEDKIYERLKEADSRIDKLEDHVKSMTESYLKKIIENAKPHKCPVCNGKGELWPQGSISYDRCESCEGNGIVWG